MFFVVIYIPLVVWVCISPIHSIIVLSFVCFSSSEWGYVDSAEKKRILNNSEDGEFWWVHVMNLLQTND